MTKYKVRAINHEVVFINKNTKTTEMRYPIVTEIVLFLDALASYHLVGVRKTIAFFERAELILTFLEKAGFVEKKRTASVDVWIITDECFKAAKRGRTDHKRDYMGTFQTWMSEMTRFEKGVRLDYVWLFGCLSFVFRYDEELFFQWLATQIDTIKIGLEVLPRRGLRGERKDNMLGFALWSGTVLEVKRCASRFNSRVARSRRRKEKRRAERRRLLAEKNINCDKSSDVWNFSTELPPESAKAVTIPNHSDPVDTASKVIALD